MKKINIYNWLKTYLYVHLRLKEIREPLTNPSSDLHHHPGADGVRGGGAHVIPSTPRSPAKK